MEEKIRKEQLNQVIAEVQKLAEAQKDELVLRQDNEFAIEQVREILTELNLPPELLEKAIAKVQKKEALTQRRKRNSWIAGGIAGILCLLFLGNALFAQNRQRMLAEKHQRLASIGVQQDRLTLATNSDTSLSQIPLDDEKLHEEVRYHAVLTDISVGEELFLYRTWVAPNRSYRITPYKTPAIQSSTWSTSCPHSGLFFEPGTWRVKLTLGSSGNWRNDQTRLLSEETFEVQ